MHTPIHKIAFLAAILGLALSITGPARAQGTGVEDVTVELGGIGFDMEFDEARRLLYVSVPTLNEIVLVSTRTFEIVDRVTVGSRPQGIDLSDDGATLYVALNGAGAVAVLDLESLTTTEIVVAAVLGDSRTYDVIEARGNRVFVSANPGSSGFARIGMIKRDSGDQVVRVANNRIIRARPTFEVSPDQNFLYVGEGFSPNSLYKLDIQQDTAPIVLEDRHGSVSGTDFLEVNPDGTRVYLSSGQVLRTASFISAGRIGRGVPQFGDSAAEVFVAVAGSPTIVETYDTDTFQKIGEDIILPCNLPSFSRVGRLIVLPDETGWLVLANDLVCGVTRGVFMSEFAVTSALVSLGDAGSDQVQFAALFELNPESDGIDPAVEEVSFSVGSFDEVIPAFEFICRGSLCIYTADGPGITRAVIQDFFLAFRAQGLDFATISNPTRVQVQIGNDEAATLIRLRGDLRSGPEFGGDDIEPEDIWPEDIWPDDDWSATN